MLGWSTGLNVVDNGDMVILGEGEGIILDALVLEELDKGGVGRGEILNDRGGVIEFELLYTSYKR